MPPLLRTRSAPRHPVQRLAHYDEMLELGLTPDAAAHAAALRELERGGAHHAARAASVRAALAAARRQPRGGECGDEVGGEGPASVWPPLRYGKQGGEQTRHGHRVVAPGGARGACARPGSAPLR